MFLAWLLSIIIGINSWLSGADTILNLLDKVGLVEYKKKAKIKRKLYDNEVFICFKDGTILKRNFKDLIENDKELYEKIKNQGKIVKASFELPVKTKNENKTNEAEEIEPIDIGWFGNVGVVVLIVCFLYVMYLVFNRML